MADRVPAKTYVVLSDVHLPYESKTAIDAVCELIKDIQPHGVVLAGDILDLPEISRHNRGSVALLEGKRVAHTFVSGNKFLDRIDAVAGPRCKDKHWIDGNHEHRFARWVQSGDNVVFADDDCTSIPYRLKLADRGYIYHGDYPNGFVRLGKLLVTHGTATGKYPAAKHMEKYQTSILVGHTHTQQTYHASTWEGQRGAYCQGFLADPDSEAMAYHPHPRAWIQGFSVVHVRPNSDFFVVPVNFVNGAAMFGMDIYPKRLRRAA